MRVRLTDGTREVDITTPRGIPLPDVEATARRLYALTLPEPEQDDAHPIGFGSLDGVALDSSTERSDPYLEPGRDEDEDEQDGAA